jgi:glycosyltransferase involved in cell wall biosynthesis
MKVAARLHSEKPFALAHHVTFVSFRVPVWLKNLGIPVVFGPVGGADMAPFHLLSRGFDPSIWCKEVLRNLLTGACEALMRATPPLRKNKGVCLAATPAMARIFKKAGFANEIFPAVGIDAGPERPPRLPGPTRFLFVGRFHPLKGTHLLLEAFAHARIDETRLTLIGTGPEETKLRELASKLGITSRVEWLGKLPREKLAEHYRSHDVLVAPSLYESGGLVALEAMAEGLPVIVLDVGGHSVSVADGCGIKIPAVGSVDDVIKALASAINSYSNAPSRIAQDGMRARKRVADTYEWSHKASHMKEIYQNMIRHK